MTFIIFAVCLIVYAYINGSMDYVAHHLDCKDLWHGLKYLDRLFMGLVGWRFAELDYQEIILVEPYWLSVVLVLTMLLTFLVIVKITVWEYAYRSYVNRVRLDDLNEGFQIHIKWKWLEKMLGFHR